jgi:hypothetical protein
LEPDPTKPVTPGVLRTAGELLAHDVDLAPGLEFHDLFHGNDDVEDLVFEMHRLDPRLEIGLHLVLIPRVGMHDEP